MTTSLSTECPTCHGQGTLGRSPSGERIHCGDCSYGVGLEQASVTDKMDMVGGWLNDCEHWDQVAITAAREYLERLTVRFDELTALLDTLKQEQTNRPRPHLFEDL